MDFTLSDAYAPVAKCEKCGGDCNLEASAWNASLPKNLVVRCILCGDRTPFGMSSVEVFYRKHGFNTWLCEDSTGKHEGYLVLGESLFATSNEKARLQEACEEEGWHGKAADRLSMIRDREELVIHYATQGDFDTAYHYAAGKHGCGFNSGHGPLNCKESVSGIVMGLEGFTFEFFSVYGVVMAAWNQLIEEIKGELHITDKKKVRITNETECRTRFVRLLEIHNQYGYEIIWGQDRPVYIKVAGKKRMKKPDLAFDQLIAIELKSFLRFQTYTAAGAKKELAKDIVKLPTYKGAFDIAFMFCISDHLSVNEMYSGTPPNLQFPVRWSIMSMAK